MTNTDTPWDQLQRSQELIDSWKSQLTDNGVNDNTIWSLIYRLEVVQVKEKSLLEKSRDYSSYGVTVSECMLTVVDAIRNDLRTHGTVQLALNLIGYTTDQVNTMEDRSAECVTGFMELVDDLTSIQTDADNHLAHLKRQAQPARKSFWRRLWEGIKRVFVAVGSALVNTFLNALTGGLVSFQASLNPTANISGSNTTEINILQDMTHRLQSRIENSKDINNWWTRARDDLHQLSLHGSAITEMPGVQLEILRQHWIDMESRMRAFHSSLGGQRLVPYDSQPTTRQQALTVYI